ncbi:MAG TPA: hypothetical protein DHU72_00515 [Rikenellaceae bacterium]|nr:hypothetical protein [Rikenellaceae bacterium]
MLLHDRFSGNTLDSNSLPNHIDLGRYFVCDSRQDITNRIINVGTDKLISQGLLESKNKSLQDLFCYFNVAISHKDNDFSVVPLIQSVKERLFLNEFESLLESKIFHLEEIFRQPHYLLQRTIEKVNVSRAKRIPAKSYQNLASHTEDWLHKSIVDFKPRRILNEELDLLYDVYENQVTIALIERCLIYLNSRIQEVHDISNFLTEYNKLLSDRNDSNGWYKKIDRNLSLIGCVYEDENYSGGMSRNDILSKTHQRLKSLCKRLKALQNAPLFGEVNHRMVLSLMSEQDIRTTNVIANHKHYRYVRDLWLALNKVDHEKSEKEREQYEQDVINGVRSYSKTIIAYVMQNVLGYELKGNYSNWNAIHPYYPTVTLSETQDSILSLTIGRTSLSFLVLANYPAIAQSELNADSYILCMCDNRTYGNIIGISPYDADSIERVGTILKSYIIKDFVCQLRNKYEYPHHLRDFISCIDSEYIEFCRDFTYSYKGLSFDYINSKQPLERVVSYEVFKQRPRTEKDAIKADIVSLIEEINKGATILSNKIICFNCMTPIQRRNLPQLNYIQCDCGFVLDSSDENIIYKNRDIKYSKLKREDWGMDYVEISNHE